MAESRPIKTGVFDAYFFSFLEEANAGSHDFEIVDFYQAEHQAFEGLKSKYLSTHGETFSDGRITFREFLRFHDDARAIVEDETGQSTDTDKAIKFILDEAQAKNMFDGDFAYYVPHLRDLIEKYGIEGFIKLVLAQGVDYNQAKFLFSLGVNDAYWVMAIDKEHFDAVVKMACAAGQHATGLLSNIPGVADLMTKSPYHLRSFVEMAEAAGGNAYWLFSSAIPPVAQLMGSSQENFQACKEGFIKLTRSCDDEFVVFVAMADAVPALAPLMVRDTDHFNAVINELTELARQPSSRVWAYGAFREVIPALAPLMTRDLTHFAECVKGLREIYSIGGKASENFSEGIVAAAPVMNLSLEHFQKMVKIAGFRKERTLIVFKEMASVAKLINKDKRYFQLFADIALMEGIKQPEAIFSAFTVPAISALAEESFENGQRYANAFVEIWGQLNGCELGFFTEVVPAYADLITKDFDNFQTIVRLIKEKIPVSSFLYYVLVPLAPLMGQDIHQFEAIMKKLPPPVGKEAELAKGIYTVAPLMVRSEAQFDTCLERLRELRNVDEKLIHILEPLVPLLTQDIDQFMACSGKLLELAKAYGCVSLQLFQVLEKAAPLMVQDYQTFTTVADGLIKLAQALSRGSNPMLLDGILLLLADLMFKDLDNFNTVVSGLLEIIQNAGEPGAHALLFSGEGFWPLVEAQMSKRISEFVRYKDSFVEMARVFKELLVPICELEILSLVLPDFLTYGFNDRVQMLIEIYLTLGLDNNGRPIFVPFGHKLPITKYLSKYVHNIPIEKLQEYSQLRRDRLLLEIFRDNIVDVLGVFSEGIPPDIKEGKLGKVISYDTEFRDVVRQELLDLVEGISEILPHSPLRLTLRQKMAATHLLVKDLKKLLSEMATDPRFAERYRREAEKVARAILQTATASYRGEGPHLWLEGWMAYGDSLGGSEEQIRAFQARLLAELLEPCVYRALCTLGLNNDMAALTTAFEYFREVESVETMKLYSNNLSRLIKDKEIPISTKERIIDFYLDFFGHPERARFLSQEGKNAHLKSQIVAHFTSDVLFVIRDETGFPLERREAMLLKAIDIAEKFKSTTTPFSARFALGLAMNLQYLLLVERSPLALKYKDRIDRLYQVPKGPDKSLFTDGLFVAKVYFQERVKQDLWERMYINPKYGYEMESFQLAAATDESGKYSSEALLEIIGREGNSLWGRYQRHSPFFTQVLESDKRDQILEELASFLNTYVRNGYIRHADFPSDWADKYKSLHSLILSAKGFSSHRGYISNSPPSDWHQLYDLLDILGLVAKAVYSRYWKEGKEKRGQVIIVPRAPYYMHHFSGSVFEADDTDPYHVDYRVFNGHAGGGTILEDSFEDADSTTEPLEIQIANCWSAKELLRIQQNLPFAHPIITKRGAWSNDGAMIFGYMMEGVRSYWEKLTYADVRSALDANNANPSSGICYISPAGKVGKCHEHERGNRIFIDEPEYGVHSDIDGDNEPDYLDRHFDFIFEAPFENWNDLEYEDTTSLDTPRSKAGSVLGNLDAVFEDEPFLRHFSEASGAAQVSNVKINTGSDYRLNLGFSKGWCWGSTYERLPLVVSREDEIYKVALNIGYANQSRNALRVLAYHQLAKQLAQGHPQLNREMIASMFRGQDLSGQAAILGRAKIVGLELKDLEGAWEKLVAALGSEENAINYVSEIRGIILAFKFLQRYYEKYSRILEINPNSEKARERLKDTRELYEAAVKRYNLPAIGFETAMQLMQIDTSPTGWYIAYALKQGLVLPSPR